MTNSTDEIRAVYEKFKHLDIVFQNWETDIELPAVYKVAAEMYRAIKIAAEQEKQPDALDELKELRALGWMVAVHNDYRLNGEFHTFWLMTHADGRYIKGEGLSDVEAIASLREQAKQREDVEEIK